jgi:signal transduction histidine kinase
MISKANRNDDSAQFALRAVEGTETHARRVLAVGEMAAGLVHDVRNVLAAVDAGVRLAEQNLGQPEVARTYLQAVREGIARAAIATSNVINLATHAPTALSVENANDLISRLLPLLECAAGHRIRLQATLTPNIPLCVTEVSGFQNALLNLVVNARDAMPSGGEVQIRTDHVGAGCDLAEDEATAFVRVSVQDQGHGMSREVMQEVFTPFFTTKGKDGSGLGLPQVSSFLRSVNGRLQISSEPGRGASIQMLFVASTLLSSCSEERV